MPYKIVDSDRLDSKLTELADKLRAKNGTTEGLDFFAGDFSKAADSIPAPKPEQEKTITITENGDYEVVPDEGMVMSKATVKVRTESADAFKAELSALIDESGVLDSTEGTAIEKVGQLIHGTDLLLRSSQVSFSGDKTITSIDFYLGGNYANLNDCFNGASNLKTMVGINTRNARYLSRVFANSGIVSIEEPFDFSNAVASYLQPFYNANHLVEVRLVPETMHITTRIESRYLSDESLQSIINGLATVETQQKVILHSSVAARLTEEQLTEIADKNWYIG